MLVMLVTVCADKIASSFHHGQVNLIEAKMYTPKQVAEVLMLSRSTAYDLMGNGTIPSVKIGGCRRVPRDAFHDYIDTLVTS